MKLAGIDRSTEAPAGGEIVRGPEGKPTGVFTDTAMELVYGLEQAAEYGDEADVRTLMELAAAECFSKGITSFHDAGSSFREIDIFKAFVDEGKPCPRLYVMINENNEMLKRKLTENRIIGYGDNRLTVRAVKRLIDGALGSRGAWLFEPYSDRPGTKGLNTTDLETMTESAKLAIETGFQLCTHAIGDRANHETLTIYEKAFTEHPESKDLRWRIEHAQHLATPDIPRFAQLGVIASMQGIHCTSDAPWVIERLGRKRAEEGAYVWRKLIDAGTIIINGTDSPVEDVNPIDCYYSSVTRKLEDGSLFYPEQRMSREEALRSYTLNPAYAAFEEGIKGSLTPGKLADITVLTRDILTVSEEDIPGTKVLYTIMGGEVVYRADLNQ